MPPDYNDESGGRQRLPRGMKKDVGPDYAPVWPSGSTSSSRNSGQGLAIRHPGPEKHLIVERRMEELIIKYLTDTLSAPEAARFRTLLSSDPEFRREFERMQATLALADFSLDYSAKDEAVERKLDELLHS